jgi:hypothetical protein
MIKNIINNKTENVKPIENVPVNMQIAESNKPKLIARHNINNECYDMILYSDSYDTIYYHFMRHPNCIFILLIEKDLIFRNLQEYHDLKEIHNLK